jgi:hypothetical protein
MDAFFKSILWAQFGAAIDMLENAMRACPDALWTGSRFWYISYHTLFFLDFYLSDPADAFAPPAPFTLDELDPAGLLPDRPYTKEELQAYLDHGRKKCRAVIEALTEEKARGRRDFGFLDLTFAELLLYTMRHVQHHAGQLNLILRQQTDAAPRWVRQALP